MGIVNGNFKKALSAYSLYVKDVYNEYKEQSGSAIDALRKVALSWKELDLPVRQEYERRAEEVS